MPAFRMKTGNRINRVVWYALQTIVIAIAMAVAPLTGCSRPPAPPPPPPPAVTVTLPVERTVVRWNGYSGYLSSPQTANVKARVSGLIIAAPFKEGALVHQGDLLFKIDPRPFQADLDNKRAAVAQAKATSDQAKLHFQRYAALIGAKVVSAETYDEAKAEAEEAQASLSAAEAALETARLNLRWTDVRAPISGRISKINVTVGNLVSGGSEQAMTLTTIVSVDPMYCYINVPESTALRYQEMALAENQASVAGARVPCLVRVDDESGFPHRGVIDFIDNQVDVNTGTVQMRCVLPNPAGFLTPGLFALTRIPVSGRYQALLIPDAAVNSDQNERYLLIVGANNVVQRRKVTLGALFGDLRAISTGLKPDERVIVNGMQFAMPGRKVNPHEVPISSESLAAIAAEAESQGLPQTHGAAAPNAQMPAEAHQ
jgi:RND family efflux transporter MFP subunit